jgi:hypothetical protein
MPGIGIGIGIGFGSAGRWSSYWTNRSLFFLDGTIITVGESKYFKDRSSAARNFLITDYDFDSTWTKGFPYKSAATISAPAADAALIAADINNFLYDSDGTPNQIPVVSLFQDIDYEHKIFCKHVVQITDTNEVEMYEPRVLEIFMTVAALSSIDLIKAQTYFNVPVEVVNNVAWIDTVAGVDATGNGTKALPYKTFAKALTMVTDTGTIYLKTGDLALTCLLTKGISIIGTGYSLNSLTGTGTCFWCSNTGTSPLIIKGIVCNGGAAIGIRLDANAGNVLLQSNKITANSVVYGTTVNGAVGYAAKYNVLTGQHFINFNNVILDTNYIGSFAVPVRLYANLVSKNNLYKGTSSRLIQRHANTTSILLLGDNLANGSLFVDQAIATETTVTVNRCRANLTTGSFISLVDAASKVTFLITNNIINQTGNANLNIVIALGNSVTIDNNIITGLRGYIARVTALTEGKELTVSNNICKSNYGQVILATDYTASIYNNIIISETEGSKILCTSVKYDNISVLIHNNYMVTKAGTGPFVLIGTEYSTAIDGRLNGSKVYNNRFSGPGDWGNDPGALHGLFTWNQAVEWCYNYLSGSFLGYVFKSNGGTFVNKIHHNLIENCGASFTIKGIKGTLIYNNTNLDSGGYDGLSESVVGVEGDSGSSKVKNNIIVDLFSTYAQIQIAVNNFTGCEFNKNVYYNPNAANARHAVVEDITYTIEEWQAILQDLNSIIQNPNLDSNLNPETPFTTGEDLGVAYDDGLDASTTWGNENTVPVVVTKQQGENWDIGAYVH